MPRKARPTQLTPNLLARFDDLLWTHTEAFARDYDGASHEKLSDADYVEEYETRRRQSHATLSALDRRGADLERVWYVLLVARYSEVYFRREWKAFDTEQTRRMILKHVPRSPEWQWLRRLLTPSILLRGQRPTRGRRGPLGTPWLTTAEAELKALGVPPRYRERLFWAFYLRPLAIKSLLSKLARSHEDAPRNPAVFRTG